MIKLMAFAAFAIAVTTSAQAMPLAPVHEPEGMITQAAVGCGAGRTRVNGVCVARTTKVKLAGVHDGMEALACNTTETRPNRAGEEESGVALDFPVLDFTGRGFYRG